MLLGVSDVLADALAGIDVGVLDEDGIAIHLDYAAKDVISERPVAVVVGDTTGWAAAAGVGDGLCDGLELDEECLKFGGRHVACGGRGMC